MTSMSHRERVMKALNHEEPDRVPIDLGGTTVTGIDLMAYVRLAEYLGFEEEAGVADEPFSQRLRLVSPSEAVLQRFGSDFRAIPVSQTEVIPEVRLSDLAYVDEWGVTWERPEGGHYMDKYHPFQEQEPSLADLEKYRWPEPRDPGRVRGMKDKAVQLRKETDCATVISFPYGILSLCQRLRGFAEWLEDLILNPILAEAFLEHSVRLQTGMAEHMLEEVGDNVDVFMFPDDLGFQDRPYMRPQLYRDRVKPYHRRYVEAIKSKTNAKVLLHSDGAIAPLIPDLIEIGIDAINPIQVSAKGMNARDLQAEYGKDMSFWGAIDTQHTLPFGTPEDIRKEVKERIQELGLGGGYVLGTVHNIQPEVPPENIVAMFDAAREYGRY